MNTLGIIVGNRGFFPDHLCDSGRKEIFNTEKLGVKAVILPANETKFGSVNLADAESAQICSDKMLKTIDGF
jgi:hypothetical protein